MRVPTKTLHLSGAAPAPRVNADSFCKKWYWYILCWNCVFLMDTWHACLKSDSSPYSLPGPELTSVCKGPPGSVRWAAQFSEEHGSHQAGPKLEGWPSTSEAAETTRGYWRLGSLRYRALHSGSPVPCTGHPGTCNKKDNDNGSDLCSVFQGTQNTLHWTYYS